MTASPLPAALRAAAEGIYALEAATALIIAHDTRRRLAASLADGMLVN